LKQEQQQNAIHNRREDKNSLGRGNFARIFSLVRIWWIARRGAFVTVQISVKNAKISQFVPNLAKFKVFLKKGLHCLLRPKLLKIVPEQNLDLPQMW